MNTRPLTAHQMRDPNRITTVLEAIRRAWLKQPDLRLAQLLINAIGSCEPCPEVFNAEDDALLQGLARYEALTGSVTVAITGWCLGFHKISHTQVLQELAKMSLTEAKAATDAVLEGHTVEVEVRGSAAAAKLVAALREIGAVARIHGDADGT